MSCAGRAEQVLAELLARQPLPGIELEQRLHRLVLEIDESALHSSRCPRCAAGARPSRACSAQSRRYSALPRSSSLSLSAGKVEACPPVDSRSCPQRSTSFSCSELNWSASHLRVLQPVPLHDARFEQRGGRVGVVFEQLRLAFAVPGKVEAAVRASARARVQDCGDQLVERLGDRELAEAPRCSPSPRRPEAQVVQLGGDFLQAVHLRGGEGIAGDSSQ